MIDPNYIRRYLGRIVQGVVNYKADEEGQVGCKVPCPKTPPTDMETATIARLCQHFPEIRSWMGNLIEGVVLQKEEEDTRKRMAIRKEFSSIWNNWYTENYIR